jgi:outer membrane protein assembly factor BamB
MSHDNNVDLLAGRAARAREDLGRATSLRPVPPPRRARTTDRSAPVRRVPRVMRSPVVAALAVAVFVLGVLVGIGSVRNRSLDSGILASVAAGDRPVAVATDGATIWVADQATGRILAYDVDSLRPRWSVAVGPRPVAVAYGLGYVWVADAGDRQLRQLAPADGHEVRRTNTSLDPVAVVTTDRVWVLSAGNATADGYDPQTLRQDRAARALVRPTAIAAAADEVWVATDGQLARVPATGGDATTVDVGSPVGLVAINDDAVWAAGPDGTLIAVDPRTGAVLSRAALPGGATAIAAGPAGVAVGTEDGTVSWLARPGADPVVVTRTGIALTSLALAGRRLVGTSPDSGLLYRMEVPA